MAALLVSIAVMSVLMTIAMPVWRHDAQREKEAELIWRAGQIVRAVEMYKKRVANASPSSLDVLVQQKLLRKKYKDPMTKDGEWRYLSPQEMQGVAIGPGGLLPGGSPGNPTGQPGRPGMQGSGNFGSQTGGGQPGAPGSSGSSFGSSSSSFGQSPQGGASSSGEPGSGSNWGAPRGAQYNGPIAGVASKSKENSIRIFKGRTRYDQWIVTIDDVRPRNPLQQQQPGQQPGIGNPGMGQPGLGQPGMGQPGGGFPQSPGGQRPPM